MYSQPPTISCKELRKLGYRITSRKGRIAARVDREDWREYCEENNKPVDADWYRRCLSNDKIIVSSYVAKKLGSSCHDATGYVTP